MNLIKTSVLLGAVAVISMASPVYAANNGQANGTKVIAQGDGYTVTAETGPKKVEKTEVGSPVYPSLTSSYTANLLATVPQSFNGTTRDSYGNGTLSTTSTLTMTITHSSIKDDKISLKGQANAYWSGSSPSTTATNITMAPSQVVNASETVYSGGFPASVSTSRSATSLQFMWIATGTGSGYYNSTYNWGTLDCTTPGHWTSVWENDNTAWQFGSYTTSQINGIQVSIY